MVQHALVALVHQLRYNGWLDSDALAGHSLVDFRVGMLELQNMPNIND